MTSTQPGIIYRSRFSTLRFHKAVKLFSEKQRGFVVKHKWGVLLHLPRHLMVPMNLLQWINDHVLVNSTFKHNDKVINITKDMVNKIFDFPGGTVPFIYDSDDVEVVAEVLTLRCKYFDKHGRMTLKKLRAVMLSDETEEGFIRSFLFFFISCLLCPAKGNYADWRYLFSLRDVSKVPMLDFGSLCLDYLFEQSKKHRALRSNRQSLKQSSQPSFMVGCLPILGIIYMDFVDFNSQAPNQSIDYGLPRILHIKNEDFEHLAYVDRNMKSWNAFGVLPLRPISQTPYAGLQGLNNLNIGSAPQTYPQPQFNSPIQPQPEEVHMSAENNGNVEPSLLMVCPDSSAFPAIEDPTLPVAMNTDYLTTSRSLGSLQVLGIDLNNVVYLNDVDEGLEIAMPYAEDPSLSLNQQRHGSILSGGPVQDNEQGIGPSTVDKRNKKKRVAKVLSPYQAAKKMKTYIKEYELYTKYLRKNFYNDHTLFVDMSGFLVYYKTFYSSFKAKGDVAEEVLDALVQVINDDAKLSSHSEPFMKKYTFTSSFTRKLLVSPKEFHPKSCAIKFATINSQENLWKMDLLHFPFFKNNHWVLICVNSLYENTNFFDSIGMMKEKTQVELISNLVSNFSTLCKQSKISFKDFEKFMLQSPATYPMQSTLHECGYFIPLYIENWYDKTMKSFDVDIVPNYRMILAHRLFHSSRNKLKEDALPKRKK